MSKKLKLSVHGLVDAILRKGDIDNRVFNNSTMSEGSRIHLRYQQAQEGNYLSEVFLSGIIEVDDYEVTLEGRADGIIIGGKRVIIDEIKSTVSELEEFYEIQGQWHLGQGIVYAYLYSLDHDEKEMEVRLTYISQNDDSKLFKKFVFTREELHLKVSEYLKEYLSFYKDIEEHVIRRNISCDNLEFPFDEFRKGQRDLSKYVYSVCKDGGTFYFEAPTGTGKTISTLYPAIKTFPDNKNEKIFYLSAKNSTKAVAFSALKVMEEKGLKIRAILVSSKEKMCRSTGACNPDECIYAKNYYDKLRKAISELLSQDKLQDSESILEYASSKEMCPFEFQLDYSLFCDVIICDYNYLFDPLVHLKRYFDLSSSPYFALIDEAHNLAERSLDMYSAEINRDDFIILKKSLSSFKHPRFKRALKNLINSLDELKTEEEYHVFNDLDSSLLDVFEKYFTICQNVLKNYDEFVNDQFIDCFRQVNRFLKISEYYNDSYKLYYQSSSSKLVLRNLDASSFLKDTIDKIRGAVFFSATLTPLPYFIKRLGGSEDDPTMILPSPFPKSNLLLLVRGDVSTRYKDRYKSYDYIISSLISLVKEKQGNYIVFFPSYQYLKEVVDRFPENEDIKIIVQKKEMNEKEKNLFLASFQNNPSTSMLAFAVLGGSFSEGIDLTLDRLIGAVVVGVGLPLVGFERNIIKEYYDKSGLDGFDYAYTNPGMNKVLQAAGRVIRTKDDVGVVLLIDDRFLSPKYQALFKVEWSHYIPVYSDSEITSYCRRFWDNH